VGSQGKTILALVTLVIVLIIVGFLVWLLVAYNGLVSKQQDVYAQWAQVENQYQRKIDLIPQLVNVTSQYTEFEKTTISNITALRSQWQNASGVDQRIDVVNQLDQNIYAIRFTYENYPYLQSIGLVSGLMDSVEGTENRIAVERLRFNDSVRVYNTQIRKVPDNLVANSFGFREFKYYDPFPGGPGP